MVESLALDIVRLSVERDSLKVAALPDIALEMIVVGLKFQVIVLRSDMPGLGEKDTFFVVVSPVAEMESVSLFASKVLEADRMYAEWQVAL